MRLSRKLNADDNDKVLALSILRLLFSWLSLPLLTFGNLVIAQLFPISLTTLLDIPINSVGAVSLYMYAFGYIKQHPVNR